MLATIQQRFFEERGGVETYFSDGHSVADGKRRVCCGARVHLEMGGSLPVLLGGSFADEEIEAAWREAEQLCPRYFAQCQQTSPFAAVQQDMLLHMLFGNKQAGIFVDVGSVDGFSFSNTYFFERNLNWTGVCVEPNGASQVVLQRVRARAKVYEACLANLTGTAPFVQCRGYTRMLSGLVSSMSPQHFARIEQELGVHGGQCETVEVSVMALASILASNNLSNVDILSIDTEGGELGVLYGIEWEAVNISVIILEMLDQDSEESRDLVDYLLQRGYGQVAYACQDAVFAHHSFTRAPPSPPSCIRVDD